MTCKRTLRPTTFTNGKFSSPVRPMSDYEGSLDLTLLKEGPFPGEGGRDDTCNLGESHFPPLNRAYEFRPERMRLSSLPAKKGTEKVKPSCRILPTVVKELHSFSLIILRIFEEKGIKWTEKRRQCLGRPDCLVMCLLGGRIHRCPAAIRKKVNLR